MIETLTPFEMDVIAHTLQSSSTGITSLVSEILESNWEEAEDCPLHWKGQLLSKLKKMTPADIERVHRLVFAPG